MPSVSVCLPAYNSERTIARAITSVLEQTYRDFELIVIDNSSTDTTFAIIEAFTDERIRVFRNDTNIGFVGNHNRCVTLASGDLVQFVHSDDWLLPQCLETLVPVFDDPKVGLAFAPRRVDTADEEWKSRYGTLHAPLEPLAAVNSGPEIIERFVAAGAEGNWIGEPTCVMFRRKLLLDLGGFRESNPHLMDIDAWLRILALSDAAFVDEELSVRWHHGESVTYDNLTPRWALIAHMRLVSSLARNSNLNLHVRANAFRLWMKGVTRTVAAVLRSPKRDRSN